MQTYRRKGQKWVPTSDNLTDKQRVFQFISQHPQANVRAIRKGAALCNERVQEILAAGVASAELDMTRVERAHLYEITESGVKAMNAPPPPKWWQLPQPGA